LHGYLTNAARVKNPAALQRSKLDTPLLAARFLIAAFGFSANFVSVCAKACSHACKTAAHKIALHKACSHACKTAAHKIARHLANCRKKG